MTSSPGSFGLGSGSAGQSMTSLDPGVFMEEYVVALGVALALALISMVLSWASGRIRVGWRTQAPTNYDLAVAK